MSSTFDSIDQAVAVLRPFGTAASRTLTERDANAVAVLYRSYASMMRSVATHIVGSRDDAEDVVHDVFCKLPQVVNQYRSGGMGGWLKQITVSTALMHLRKARLRRQQPLPDECGTCTAGADDISLLRLDHGDELQRALSRLAPGLRQVVHLRFYFGYSHQQIAAVLGITPNTSEVRLCRALKHLRRSIHGGYTRREVGTASRSRVRERLAAVRAS